MWWTTRYSRAEGESFAELFALSSFKLTGSWDQELIRRFDRIMAGKEKVGVVHSAPLRWAE